MISRERHFITRQKRRTWSSSSFSLKQELTLTLTKRKRSVKRRLEWSQHIARQHSRGSFWKQALIQQLKVSCKTPQLTAHEIAQIRKAKKCVTFSLQHQSSRANEDTAKLDV